MIPNTAAETLRAARHKLYEQGWTNTAGDDKTGPICMMQSVAIVTGRQLWPYNYDYDGFSPIGRQAVECLNRALPRVQGWSKDDRDYVGRITNWNDVRRRNFTQVVEAFERAEKLAEMETTNA